MLHVGVTRDSGLKDKKNMFLEKWNVQRSRKTSIMFIISDANLSENLSVFTSPSEDRNSILFHTQH